MTDPLIEILKQALSCDITRIGFDDNVYHDEHFVDLSISNRFAGWFSEPDVVKQVDFIFKHCNIPEHATILDVACGHGRHTCLMGQQGHDVLGIDISEKLILHLQDSYGDGAKFEKKSFQDIDYSCIFDLAIVLGNSLSLLPRNQIAGAVQNLRSSLKTGGNLLVEFDNREYFVRNEAGMRRWNYHAERWLTLSEHYYDDIEKLEKTQDVGIDLQTMRIDHFPLVKSLYDHNELSALFKEADLREVKAFGNWDGSPVSEASPSIILIIEREFY